MATWKHIVEAAESLYNEREKYCYFYGAKGQIMTDARMEALWQASPSYFARYSAAQKKQIFDYSRGKIGLDCSGFVCLCLEKAGVIKRSDWTYSVALIGRCKNVTTDVNDGKKAPAGSLLFTSFGGGSRHIGLNAGGGRFFDIASEGNTIRCLSIKSWGTWEKAGQYPEIDYSSALNMTMTRFERPEGYLDSVTESKICGWAYDGTDCPLVVHIYVYKDNKQVDLFASTASDYRGDLKDAGKGNGNHAFNINYDFYQKFGAGIYKVVAYAINENENGVNPPLVNEHTIVIEKRSEYFSWTGKVITDLYVRVDAGKNNAILTAHPLLKENDVVEVIGEKNATDGGLWYNILINKIYNAYVNARYIVKI